MSNLNHKLCAVVTVLLLVGIGASPALDHSEWSGEIYRVQGGKIHYYVTNEGPAWGDSGESFLYLDGLEIAYNVAVLGVGEWKYYSVNEFCQHGATITLVINGRFMDAWNC